MLQWILDTFDIWQNSFVMRVAKNLIEEGPLIDIHGLKQVYGLINNLKTETACAHMI